MSKMGLMWAAITFGCWGISAFVDKLAVNRMGEKGVWIWIISAVPSLLTMLAFVFFAERGGWDKTGIWLTILSSILTMAGAITYYMLFTKMGVAVGTALTAVYPALAVILGILFLNEVITWRQGVGIVCSLAAIWLLAA